MDEAKNKEAEETVNRRMDNLKTYLADRKLTSAEREHIMYLAESFADAVYDLPRD